jgi:hypothetical protein
MTINSNVTIYGRIAPNSQKFDVKSKEAKVIGSRFPIGYDIIGGYFTKSTGVELVKNNLKQLLLTERGERVMLPNFGTGLKKYLMEQMDETLFQLIKSEIIDSINRYARDVELIKIQVLPKNGNYLSIKLFCKINEPSNTSFNLLVEIK